MKDSQRDGWKDEVSEKGRESKRERDRQAQKRKRNTVK